VNYEKIGTFIANKRKEKNLTQKDLAKIIGVTDKAVSKWERGLGCPDVSLLELLANALDVSILEILKGRIIENEVIPITEANDYVLETVNYTNNETKKKYDKLIQNIITCVIVSICSLLLFLNIFHIIYLNKTEVYNFTDNSVILDMKEKINKIENNINLIKNEKNIFTLEEKEKIVLFLETVITEYKDLSILSLNGTKQFKLKDLYLLDLEIPHVLNVIDSYRVLIKYNKTLEENLNLFIATYMMRSFIGNELYSEPRKVYKYNLSNYKYNELYYLGRINPRLYNLNWYLEELLYFSNQVVKVGEINE